MTNKKGLEPTSLSLKSNQQGQTDSFLVLPDGPSWVSEPPKVSYVEMIRQCEKQLSFWNERRRNALQDSITPSPEVFKL